jgi:hypothetical protein
MTDYERKFKLEVEVVGDDGFQIFHRKTLPAAAYEHLETRTILLTSATAVPAFTTDGGPAVDLLLFLETTGKVLVSSDQGLPHDYYPGAHVTAMTTDFINVEGRAGETIEVQVTVLKVADLTALTTGL